MAMLFAAIAPIPFVSVLSLCHHKVPKFSHSKNTKPTPRAELPSTSKAGLGEYSVVWGRVEASKLKYEHVAPSRKKKLCTRTTSKSVVVFFDYIIVSFLVKEDEGGDGSEDER